MKLPLSWLKTYVEIPKSVKELTDKLTAIGHMQDHQPEKVGEDVVLDLEVRQNRSDCLSVVGLAREVAASQKTTLKVPKLNSVLPKPVLDSNITIADEGACYRFNTLQIDNIKIATSPKWLTQRLEAYGVKSINNLVDVTNFVMIEQGQPLHAFDRNKVNGKLTIRLAKKDEKIQILGEKIIKLTSSDLIISDDTKVLALAGIIGGMESSINDKTSSIILEAATYNQAYIRRSSLRHSIRTEASLRHEKFLHPELTEVALTRALDLISEVCGGTIRSHDDSYVRLFKPITLQLSVLRLRQLSGVEIETKEAVAILSDLGLRVIEEESALSVEIPYFRTDLTEEEDIIEEILRIHGYEKIPDTLPKTSPPDEITSRSFLFEEEIRDILVGYGFDEVITEPLVSEKSGVDGLVKLQNSLNADKTMLRTTLKHGLTSALTYQRKARKKEVTIFELGKVYSINRGKYAEHKMLGGIVSTTSASYLSVKGLLEALCARLGYQFDPGLINIERTEEDAWYFEIQIEKLSAKKRVESFKIRTNIPQIIYQDLSFSVPSTLKIGHILKELRSVSSIIYRVDLGEKPFVVSNNRKNVFIKLQYHMPGEQLTTKDIDPVRSKVIRMLETQFQAALR